MNEYVVLVSCSFPLCVYITWGRKWVWTVGNYD